MVVDSGKATDSTEEVYMEEVDTVEEDVVVIQISPTTPGMVLISDRFLGISAVPIGVLFRDTVKHLLVINIAVQRLVADAVTTVHAGWVGVAEDNRSQKLKLIGQTPALEDVVLEYVLHIMALTL